ncbi:NUDIX domain-containing protein [Aquimarina sp. MMG016]|uniref:NUDIX hydrolase n=1 Tax=Aquimarina sp. MMG016 TaxID=2822690 RepID=UPI001B3A63C7|nr:NUDIX domain-containing protein [Aquimarina sp. MMG016]MBQ4821597.1 NUDIX domain-containing protein [Aquimarina sp. MMG016]
MADELIDILDKSGKLTGEVRLKSEAHRLGLYHASVHIWFYNKEGKILFQKRADDKDTFPGFWDVSVAGHISAGESPEGSAIREIEEEIGVSVTQEDLEFIGVYLAEKTPKPNLFDNEFHHIYTAELKVPLEKLTLQEEEVADIKLISVSELKNRVENAIPKEYVPHDTEYFELILKEITNRLA